MSIYEHSFVNANDETISLQTLKGRILLIVNVASRCGFTPQYQGLAQLHHTYHKQGLTILAFPCNQFGAQEPGNISSIQEFCEQQYQLPFAVLQKCDINGKNAIPLYQYLKKSAPGLMNSQCIKWNFCKFLVSHDGQMIERFAPTTTPKQLIPIIEKLISKALSK